MTAMQESRKIFLVGYTGCGKTSLGRKLARRLHIRFIDTDDEIEQREQASVGDIFHYAGEEYFRRAERAVLEQIASDDGDAVVSTGGGMPVRSDNAELLNKLGITVYIRRKAEQIARRLTPYGRAKRPRLHGLNDAELTEFMERDIEAREPYYAKAHYTIDGSLHNDAELLDELLKIFTKGNEQ